MKNQAIPNSVNSIVLIDKFLLLVDKEYGYVISNFDYNVVEFAVLNLDLTKDTCLQSITTSDDHCLLALLKSADENGNFVEKLQLEIVAFPSYECVFKDFVKLGTSISIEIKNDEPVMLISEDGNEICERMIVNMITDYFNDKIHTLVCNEKFEEAIRLSIKVGFDPEIIHRKRLDFYLQKDGRDADICENILGALKSINNVVQRPDILEITMDTIFHQEELFMLLVDKMRTHSNDDDSDVSNEWISRILQLQERLKLFQMVHGGIAFNCETWTQFKNLDNICIFRNCLRLKAGGIYSALFSAWELLNNGIIVKLQEDTDLLKAILRSLNLFENYESSELLRSWFIDKFFMTCLNHAPYLAMNIVFWLESTLSDIIYNSTNQSNDVTMKFLSEFLTKTYKAIEKHMNYEFLMNSSSDDEVTKTSQVWLAGFIETNPLKSLSLMLERLQCIEELDVKYNLKLTASQYVSQTKESIGCLLMDRAIKNMSTATNLKVMEYLESNGMNKEKFMQDYIIRLINLMISPEGKNADFLQKQIFSLLDHVKNEDFLLDAVHRLIPVLPLELPKEFNKFIKFCKSFPGHPMLNELNKALAEKKINQILYKYGLLEKRNKFNLDWSKVVTLLLRIAWSNTTESSSFLDNEAFEDAVLIVEESRIATPYLETCLVSVNVLISEVVQLKSYSESFNCLIEKTFLLIINSNRLISKSKFIDYALLKIESFLLNGFCSDPAALLLCRIGVVLFIYLEERQISTELCNPLLKQGLLITQTLIHDGMRDRVCPLDFMVSADSICLDNILIHLVEKEAAEQSHLHRLELSTYLQTAMLTVRVRQSRLFLLCMDDLLNKNNRDDLATLIIILREYVLDNNRLLPCPTLFLRLIRFIIDVMKLEDAATSKDLVHRFVCVLADFTNLFDKYQMKTDILDLPIKILVDCLNTLSSEEDANPVHKLDLRWAPEYQDHPNNNCLYPTISWLDTLVKYLTANKTGVKLIQDISDSSLIDCVSEVCHIFFDNDYILNGCRQVVGWCSTFLSLSNVPETSNPPSCQSDIQFKLTELFQKDKKQFCPILLQNMLRCHKLDLLHIQKVAQSCEFQKMYQIFEKCIRVASSKEQFKKILYVCVVVDAVVKRSLELAIIDEPLYKDYLLAIDKVRRTAYWQKMLKDSKITIQNYILTDIGTISYKMKGNIDCIKQALFSNVESPISLLEEFCDDFKLNKYKEFLSYLSFLLTKRLDSLENPDFEGEGCLRELEMVTNQAKCIFSKLKTIGLGDDVKETLEDSYMMASPYEYERIRFCTTRLYYDFKMSQYGNDIWLLNFLFTYKRKSTPTEMELRELSTSSHHLSSKRLPINHTIACNHDNAFYQFIGSEVNSYNVETWYKILLQLRIDTDELFTRSIKNCFEIILARKSQQSRTINESCFIKSFAGNTTLEEEPTPTPSIVLSKLGDFLNKIPPIEAIRLLIEFAPKFDDIDDKIEMLCLCKEFCHGKQIYSHDNDLDATIGKSYQYFCQEYNRLTIEKMLHSKGYATRENLMLLSRPADLIRSIVTREFQAELDSERVLSVYTLIDDIFQCSSDLHENFNLNEFFKNLINNVLHLEDINLNCLDATLSGDTSLSDLNSSGSADEPTDRDLLLVKNILSSDGNMNTYLINWLLDFVIGNQSNIGVRLQLRAFRSLLSVRSADYLCSSLSVSQDQLEARLTSLVWCVRLEKSLLSSLVKSRLDDPETVLWNILRSCNSMYANLSVKIQAALFLLDFGFTKDDYWTSVLKFFNILPFKVEYKLLERLMCLPITKKRIFLLEMSLISFLLNCVNSSLNDEQIRLVYSLSKTSCLSNKLHLAWNQFSQMYSKFLNFDIIN